MAKKNQPNFAIEFLTQKLKNLTEEIISEKGISKDKVRLKTQIISAIKNLQFCEKYEISAHGTSVTEVPEKGSEAYFTEFYLVDEAAIQHVPDWGIVKNDNGPITLSCFDLIIQKNN